jgi:hypothetical protein
MGTNCAPLLEELSVYLYEAEFVLENCYGIKKYTFISDVVSISNYNSYSYIHFTYLNELEIRDTTESDISISYSDILFDIDSNSRYIT